ncbi:hypothetical protein, partial [Fulvivirga kasyanovii]|uniref:hypothetical protein n=1 Tax=Fulvivirga kasyanovii TaxID=396812 RepID=UPI001C869CB5
DERLPYFIFYVSVVNAYQGGSTTIQFFFNHHFRVESLGKGLRVNPGTIKVGNGYLYRGEPAIKVIF